MKWKNRSIRYRPGSRGKGEINSASGKPGFRCAKADKPPVR